MKIVRGIDPATQAMQEIAAAKADKNEADTAYIEMMTGVDIPEEEDNV